MIFATDLDRTIIFSKRFLSNNTTNVLNIEKKNEKEISYMTNTSVKILKELINTNKIILIPITARSKNEYDRIHLLNDLNLKYVIVNNGGSIFIDGKEDINWKKYIKSKVKKLKLSHGEILNKFLNTFGFKPIQKFKLIDNLVWVIVLKEPLYKNKLNNFSEYAKKNNWRISYNGRKIYILPSFINKWDALKYLRDNYLKNKKIISSGDSDLDLDMIINSDFGIVPKHGDIVKYIPNNIKVTKNKGLLAGEEILKNVYELVLNAETA